MNVSISIFDYKIHYIVERNSVTVEKIFNHVLRKTNLTKFKEMFGLKAYHVRQKCLIWLIPRSTVIHLLRDHFLFEDGFQFHLLPRFYPASITEPPLSRTALYCLYRHTLDTIGQYRVDCPTEVFLFALMLQFRFGNMKRHLSSQLKATLLEYVSNDSDYNLNPVLATWSLFENLSAYDAMLNYLLVVENNYYYYETISYMVKAKKTDQMATVRVSVDFNQIQIENSDKTQFILPWYRICRVDLYDQKLSIKLMGSSVKLHYWSECEWKCRQLFRLIKNYHKISLQRRFGNNRRNPNSGFLHFTDLKKFIENIRQLYGEAQPTPEPVVTLPVEDSTEEPPMQEECNNRNNTSVSFPNPRPQEDLDCACVDLDNTNQDTVRW